MAAAVRAAGLEPLKFHEVRHSFVALSVAAGADAKQVSVRAGRASVAFTLDQYGNLYEDAEDRLTPALDPLLEHARPAPNAGVQRLGVVILAQPVCSLTAAYGFANVGLHFRLTDRHPPQLPLPHRSRAPSRDTLNLHSGRGR